MSVYVDNMQAKFGRMKMCHMLADSYDELMAMADKIGVKRKWFQMPGEKISTPHFDICMSKRAQAVRAGAIEVSGQELLNVIIASRAWWRKMQDGGSDGNHRVQGRD